jgi:hypothetical protein
MGAPADIDSAIEALKLITARGYSRDKSLVAQLRDLVAELGRS